MRQLISVLIFCLLIISCKKSDTDELVYPEPLPTYFTQQGNIGNFDHSTICSISNNLLFCGNTTNNITVLRTTKTGDLLQRKDIYAGYMSVAHAIAELPSGELFICGTTARNYNLAKVEILLVKTTSSGDTIWTKTYGGAEDDYGDQIIATTDGNLLIGGSSNSYSSDVFNDIQLTKINPNGDLIWSKTYSDPDQETLFHLLQLKKGGYLVSGTNEDNGNARQAYILKTDADGNKLWDKKIGPADGRWAFCTIELPTEQLLICGMHTVNGYGQILLIKTDQSGNTLWTKEYGLATITEEAYSLKANLDGSLTVIGSSYDVTTMNNDVFILKVDETGKELVFKTFGGAQSDKGINLLKDSNDDNIITGTTFSYGNNASSGNIFLTRTNVDCVFQ